MLEKCMYLNTPTFPLENVISDMPIICFWKDKNFIYRGGNKEMLHNNHLEHLDALLGKSDFELARFRADADKYTDQDKYVLRGNTIFNIATLLEANGTKSIHLIKKGPVRNQYGEIMGVVGTGFTLNLDTYQMMLSLMPLYDFKKFSKDVKHPKDIEYQYHGIAFTKRQAQVLSAILKGQTTEEMAHLLNLSKRTIEGYIEKIKEKLDCNNKFKIIGKAFSMGFIELMFMNIE